MWNNGYKQFKRKIKRCKGIDIDKDKSYDYRSFYNQNPMLAKLILKDKEAHFPDTYKTVYHPTFSTESIYSGVINKRHNPRGLVGGTWSNNGHIYTMHPDGYNSPVSMDERKAYLENAETQGVQLREADGSLPVYDGVVWGGVLPEVIVKPQKGNKNMIQPFLPKFEGGLSDTNTKSDSEYRKTLSFLKKHEGFRPTVYKDGNGVDTIGYGFTDKNLIKKGRISRAEADAILLQEVKKREKEIRSYIKNWDELGENSRVALRSYYYNYPKGLKNGTKFRNYWDNGQWEKAIREVDAGWNDKKNSGLRKRRMEEQQLLISDPLFNIEQRRPLATPVQQKPIIDLQQNTPLGDMLLESSQELKQPTVPFDQSSYQINNVNPYIQSLLLNPLFYEYQPYQNLLAQQGYTFPNNTYL